MIFEHCSSLDYLWTYRYIICIKRCIQEAVNNQKFSIAVYWGIDIFAFVWFYGVSKGYTWGVNKRDQFFTVNNLFSLKLLDFIHPILTASCLQKVNLSSTLVSEVFAISQNAVKSITVSKTNSTDEFIKNLSIDQYSNVQETKDLVQKRMMKWIFPKSHTFEKMCPDWKQDIRKSWDLHSVLYKQVWGSKKIFLKNVWYRG